MFPSLTRDLHGLGDHEIVFNGVTNGYYKRLQPPPAPPAKHVPMGVPVDAHIYDRIVALMGTDMLTAREIARRIERPLGRTTHAVYRLRVKGDLVRVGGSRTRGVRYQVARREGHV